jgi:RHS repeat-associated protein
MQGAGTIGGILSADLNGTTAFYCYDANGNVTDLVDTNGDSVAHYEYDPFGGTIVQSGTMAENNPYRFSTKYFDENVEFYYYGYRYYSSEMGRWPSRDPIEELGFRKSVEAVQSRSFLSLVALQAAHGNVDHLNLYLFVANRPISAFDFLGLAGGTTHGTRSCRPTDTCSVLLTRIYQWSDHLLERNAELLADARDLRRTDPVRYNNHVRMIYRAGRNLGQCFKFYFEHEPPCGRRPPRRVRIRMPRFIPEPVSIGDRIVGRIPGSDRFWRGAEYASWGLFAIGTGGAVGGAVLGGGAVCSGAVLVGETSGALTPLIIFAR